MSSFCLYHNIGTLLTLAGAVTKKARHVKEKDLGIITEAAFITKADQIVWVGYESDLPKSYKTKCRKKIDLKKATVMPAFIECHTHSLYGGSRAHEFEMRNQGATYQQIAAAGGGILSTVKQTRSEKDRNLVNLLNARLEAFVQQGVTTIEVKSGYGLNHEQEIRLLSLIKKIKLVRCISTFLGPHAKSPETSDYEDYIEQIIKKTLPEIIQRKLSERADIFVEDGYFSLDMGKKYWQRAKDLGFKFTVHADQLTHTGAAAVAAQFGAISVDHLVQISKEDVLQLAKSESTCVLLPTADFYLKMPYPPARSLLDAGARVALATDFNPGSSPSLDLSLVGILARLNMDMNLPEIIVAYTLGAAYALGLEAQLGSITPGKSADFIVLEGSWRELFYQVGMMPIQSTWSKNQKIFQKKFAF